MFKGIEYKSAKLKVWAITAVAILGLAIPIGRWVAHEGSYMVSSKSAALLPPAGHLSQKLTFDTNAESYKLAAYTKNSDKTPPPYTAYLSKDGSNGIKFVDSKSDSWVKLIPQFAADEGRTTSTGKVIYSIAGGGQAVYSAQQNGLKEDILLSSAPSGNAVDYVYKISLSAGLTAKLLSDGSVGVFTAASKLPAYTLPKPTIKQTGNKANSAKAWFTFSGDVLHLKATGLNTLTYPISIDPSVFDTFWKNANSSYEDTAGFTYVTSGEYQYIVGGYGGSSTGSQVRYAHVNSDGTLGAWNYTSDFGSVGSGRYQHATVVNNGYMYVLGGFGDTGALADVLYAPINPDGTLGSWNSTSAFNTAGPARYGLTATVSNGYIYVLGGSSNHGAHYKDTLYAPINLDGSIGEWNSTLDYASDFGRTGLSSFVYNGRIYAVGGEYSSSPLVANATAYYATLNPDGTVGAWTEQANNYLGACHIDAATYDFGNGYFYGSTACEGLYYTYVNGDGSLASWTTAPSVPFYTQQILINNGRIYSAHDITDGTPTGISDVVYADIDASTDGERECDNISVIYCGAYTKSELLDKVNNGDGQNSAANIQNIFYNELGYNELASGDVITGRMYENGDIYVGDVLVATGARPYGRQHLYDDDVQVGSLWHHSHVRFFNGTTEQDIFVHMDSTTGLFAWGILKPCGNPVSADSANTIPTYTPTTPEVTPSGSPSPSESPSDTPTPTPTDTTTPAPFGPVTSCCQLIDRSVTLGNSVVDAGTTADFTWKRTGDDVNIKAVEIQICTASNNSEACVKPTDADMSSVTLASTGGELGASGWSLAVLDDHSVLITNPAGANTTAGVSETIGLAAFVNPSAYSSFYFRITTYRTTAAAPVDKVDCGIVAASTAKSITTTADVAEMLIFRVANEVNSDCLGQTDVADPDDTTEDLVSLSPSPISLTTASTSTAQFCIVTNSIGGYVIAYHDEAMGGITKGFWNGGHEFGTLPSSTNGGGTYTNFTSTPGTEQFGFNLRANTVPVFGADPDMAGLVTDLINPQYSVANQYSYDDSGSAIALASKSSPTSSARYTLGYLANISSLTPGGTYRAHQVFVATATF